MTLLNLTEVVADLTDESAFNNVQDAITGDLYPRTAGVATDKAGDLGSETYPWHSASIESGYVPSGTIFPWYDFDGLLDIPQGYMLCNGDTVSRAAYNTQHQTDVSDTTDYWELYIGSSPADGLKLPSLSNKFIKGTTSATQDGSAVITYSGNTGNTVNLQHNHGGATSTGTVASIDVNNAGLQSWVRANNASHSHSFTVNNDLSTAQDITPLSHDVKYLARILE